MAYTVKGAPAVSFRVSVWGMRICTFSDGEGADNAPAAADISGGRLRVPSGPNADRLLRSSLPEGPGNMAASTSATLSLPMTRADACPDLLLPAAVGPPGTKGEDNTDKNEKDESLPAEMEDARDIARLRTIIAALSICSGGEGAAGTGAVFTVAATARGGVSGSLRSDGSLIMYDVVSSKPIVALLLDAGASRKAIVVSTPPDRRAAATSRASSEVTQPPCEHSHSTICKDGGS
jgi:hypothetical protein